MQDRTEIVHQNFLDRVKSGNLPETTSDIAAYDLTASQAIQIFESQCLSRQLDNISRKLQAKGEGFYTIGSSGHEGNAAIAAALRVDDMAFLHYRDGAFVIERAKQLPGQTSLWDMLLSFTASAEDPISGGRHKVLGSKPLNIPPQTSTIASHLPKAVGAAYSIGLNKKLGHEGELARDSIIACSFGDASLNHSTAQGAINTASWTAYQGVSMPLLFICEDNGLGISVPTPQGWVAQSVKSRPSLKYFSCDGLNIFDVYKAALEAQDYTRKTRKPAFLHMSCVRLFGHAGADPQHVYLSKHEIEAMEAKDPLLHSASLMIQNGLMTADQILEMYGNMGARLERAAEHVIKRPKLETADEVMGSIIPPKRNTEPVKAIATKVDGKHHLAKIINLTLHDIMASYDNVVLAGEDVGRKGGVYNVTTKLQQEYGAHRVIDTVLDEQSILGLGIGLAHNDIIPIPEIQFLAYLHNAEDQLRGEAATLSFFSKGQYTNPMVIRIAGLGYQKGFGGHFHNDNAFAVLRDIPGIIVVCPSNGADAPALLREALRLAHEEQRIVVFLEPIALYMTKDLHEPKDGGWQFEYDTKQNIALGEVGQHGEGKDLCILTYGNGYYLSRQAAKVLEEKHKVKTRIVDLRWLVPVPEQGILDAVKGCKNVLIVDETRESGSISEALMTLLRDHPNCERLSGKDSFIPLGKAYAATMPSKETIIDHSLKLVKKKT